MTETPKAISEWATATFGPPGSDARVAARANEEMAELLRAVTADATPDKIRDECADVVIILCRLCDRNGGDLWQEVERKMAINRAREWKLDGTGHGYHVRDKTPAKIERMAETHMSRERGNF